MKLPKRSENYFQKSLIDRANKEIFPNRAPDIFEFQIKCSCTLKCFFLIKEHSLLCAKLEKIKFQVL